jgi:hypothetical protein
MKKSLIITVGIVLLIIIAGLYLFTRSNKGEEIVVKINRLQKEIVVAKDKLDKENKKLEAMGNDLRNSFPFAASVQDQMKKATEIVKQTDFMFTNASGLNPELIIKNLLNSVHINNERKEINLFLLEWQKKMDILSLQTIDITEGEKIKQEVETIKTFLEDLSQLIGNLTVENSGFSQFQINTYSSQLPPIGAINEVLASLQNAIENSNSQTSSNSSTIVSSEEIITQGEVVADIQTQVVSLEEQLVEAQGGLPPPVLPPVEVIPTNPGLDIDVRTIDRSKYQGIIIQPGPPRLIEGSNQY